MTGDRQVGRDVPVWRLSRYGEDERPVRHRLTWRQVGLCVFALAVGVYGGLLLAVAWRA
ncbi:MAG: hypothetical protein ACRDO7_15970 [Nocardioidaceae bacterium]